MLVTQYLNNRIDTYKALWYSHIAHSHEKKALKYIFGLSSSRFTAIWRVASDTCDPQNFWALVKIITFLIIELTNLNSHNKEWVERAISVIAMFSFQRQDITCSMLEPLTTAGGYVLFKVQKQSKVYPKTGPQGVAGPILYSLSFKVDTLWPLSLILYPSLWP